MLAILHYNLKGISDAVGMSGVPAPNCVHKLTPEALLPIHRHAATQDHQGAILGAISRACTFFSSILLHPRTTMAAAVVAGAATWVAFLLALDLSSLIANKNEAGEWVNLLPCLSYNSYVTAAAGLVFLGAAVPLKIPGEQASNTRT